MSKKEAVMSKIDRYVRIYEVYKASGGPRKGLERVLLAIVGETKKMASKDLRASEQAKFCAILNEQDRRWREFAKRIPEALPDGFVRIIKHEMPETYFNWMVIRAKIGLPRFPIQ